MHGYTSPLDPLGGYNVYHSSGIPDNPPHNGQNETRIALPALDEAYDTVRNSADFAKVRDAMGTVQEIYGSDQNTFELPLFLRKDVWLVSPKIHNFTGNPSTASGAVEHRRLVARRVANAASPRHSETAVGSPAAVSCPAHGAALEPRDRATRPGTALPLNLRPGRRATPPQRTMPMILAIQLDRASREPLYRQIESQLRASIQDGRLRPGALLPGVRTLAGQLGVARITIVTAYEQLTSEGLLEARVGSGTRVADTTPRRAARTTTSTSTSSPSWHPARRDARAPAPSAYAIDLRPGGLPPDPASAAAWESALRAAWRQLAARGGADAPGSTERHPAGDPDLRALIAERIGATRGIRCSAAEVVIVAGRGAAFAALAELLLPAGAAAVVEDPADPRASAALESAGARLIPVPVDVRGLRTELLPASAAIARVTPAWQERAGGSLSLDRRLDLLAWAGAFAGRRSSRTTRAPNCDCRARRRPRCDRWTRAPRSWSSTRSRTSCSPGSGSRPWSRRGRLPRASRSDWSHRVERRRRSSSARWRGCSRTGTSIDTCAVCGCASPSARPRSSRRSSRWVTAACARARRRRGATSS